MEGLAVYCADVGSIRAGNFGWAVVNGSQRRHGKDIDGLVDDVVVNLSAGTKAALGFECPRGFPCRRTRAI